MRTSFLCARQGMDVNLVYHVYEKGTVVLLEQRDESFLLVEGENGTDEVARVNDAQCLGFDAL